MMNISFNLFITIIGAALTLFLGLMVLLHDRKNATNQIFIVHAVVGGLWSIVNYFSVTTVDSTALFWIRMVIFFAVPHVFLFFLFVNNFPDAKLRLRKPIVAAVLIIMGGLMGISLTPYGFSDITVVESAVLPVPGKLMPLFGLTMVCFFLFTVVQVVRKYLTAQNLLRRQWLAIGSGMLASYTSLIFLVFLQVNLFRNTTFVPYSPLFLILIFAGAAYAIFRHHLFNIKIIATEILIFALLVASFVGVLLASNTLALVLSISMTVFILGTGVLLINSVVHEVKQREQLQILTGELQQANEKLKTLDQARAEFISIASHQLRTPPATVKWYLAAVLSGDFGTLPDETRSPIKKAFDTNNHLISLIEDMLNVSRIERGKMEFLFEEVDIAEVAKMAYEQLIPQAQEHKLEFHYVPPQQPLPKIMADREKLSQVMNNLMDNAIKYTKQGMVTVKLFLNGDMVQFQVSDTGKGICPDEKSSIFQKFSRGKESIKQSAGLGLGLYVARIIIEQHHGKIWAESEGEGKGSTFLFQLPLHTDLKQTTLLDFSTQQ